MSPFKILYYIYIWWWWKPLVYLYKNLDFNDKKQIANNSSVKYIPPPETRSRITNFSKNYKLFLEKMEKTRPNQELKIETLVKVLNVTRTEVLRYIDALMNEEVNYGTYYELEDVFVTSNNIIELHDDIDDLISNFNKFENSKI